MRKYKRFITIPLLIIFYLFLAGNTGCEIEPTTQQQSSHEIGMKATEDAVKGLVTNDTLPVVTKSLERENLKRRIEFINQPDRIGYLYLLTENGQLIREVQVLGKVSSLNSYLTPMEEIKKIDADLGEWNGEYVITVQAPDLDGSYGENQNGIFWFTPDGIYQEWNGLYQYSSERLSFAIKPLLIEIDK